MRRAGKQDRSIMAITGHKTMSVFTRYDTVDEEDLKRVVMDALGEKDCTNITHGGFEEKTAVT